MEVFISWSGGRSEKVAEALRDWLPSVIQSVKPFMSASDIDKGARWSEDIARHLQDAQFGLICLTQENLKAPWLLFEAGALSKSIENSRVVPFLYEVSSAQLEGPLAQFQASVADKNSTLELVRTINGALEGDALELARLENAFEIWWPQLEKALENIPKATKEAPPSRTDSDILKEVLQLTRQMSRQRIPDFEIEQEALRNLMAHGLHTNPVDSNEDLDPESSKFPFTTALRQTGLIREQLERNRRDRQEHRDRQEFERRQRVRGRLQNRQRPLEGDLQSKKDIDKEA